MEPQTAKCGNTCEQNTWSEFELVQKNVNLPLDVEGWRLMDQKL